MMASLSQSIEPTASVVFTAPSAALIELQLQVADPEVVFQLEKRPAGPKREPFALAALRWGVLALRQARGELDAGVMREAGRQILDDLEALLKDQAATLIGDLANALRRYFDKDRSEPPRLLRTATDKEGESTRDVQGTGRRLGSADCGAKD